MNEYMTIKEASQKWNISIRRINTLCNEERIPGCVNLVWHGQFRWMQRSLVI